MATQFSDPDVPAVLVVDDDPGIRDLLSRSLIAHGYAVFTAADVLEMEAQLNTRKIDLILLDIMLPGEDGLSACNRLVQDRGSSIILLSALGEVDDRIAGLDVGASHYLPKPCSSREILATVRAALRRSVVMEPVARKAYAFDGWLLDASSHELIDPDGILVDLTDGEFAVLRAFVERPRRVLSRDALLEAARGPDTASFDRAIDVQVSRLRRKLRGTPDKLIRTVRNEGYIFSPRVTRL